MAISEPTEPTRPAGSGAIMADAAAPEVEAAPALEPLTPERALEWNRYYDRYIVGGVLLLVFLVSAHRISNSTIWPLLKTGELIVRRGAPITTDPYSFTEAGKPWVNIPWIYEVVSHALYQGGRSVFPSEAPVRDQVGAGVLVAFNALARVLTVVLLLRLRRPGPGTWWFAVLAALTLGCVLTPRGELLELSVGGIARQALIAPETWGILLLATEILLLDRAFTLGRKYALYAIPPLFLLWANLDESFAFGLVVLWATTIGSMLGRRSQAAWRASPGLAALIVLGSTAICVVNPSHVRIFPAAFEPIFSIPRIIFGSNNTSLLPDHLAFFGSESTQFVAASGGDQAPLYRAGYYVLVVVAGLATFALDRRRLNVGRLVTYLAAALLWGGLSRLSAEFAVVFTYVVGLNFQEWYQDRYGLSGRVSPGWTAWSIGGRALTILVFFLVMAKTLTGYGYTQGRPTFGFGVEPSEFDFESADFLRSAKITGRVMNLGESQGDALIWRAYPARKTYIDRRRGVFTSDVRNDLSAFRRAFVTEGQGGLVAKEDPSQWRPIVEKYQVSAVYFSPTDNPLIYDAMKASQNWIPIRDDGRTVLFGRADAPADDLAYFKANRLDANQIVFHRKESVPDPDRSPSAMTVIDRVIRNRALTPAQPHLKAAYRWFQAGEKASGNGNPDTAHCIMAIREARIALHFSPDETDAYRLLDVLYEQLIRNETSTLRGKTRTAPSDYLNFRAKQRATVLNYAIQTTPPPRDAAEREGLAEVYIRLARVFRSTGDLDLERDNLAAARDLVPSADFPPSELKRLEQLEDEIEKFKEDLQKFTTDRSADNLQRAARAMRAGFPGIAQHELEEAESQGVSADQLLSGLVSLYCRSGQPEKANDHLAGAGRVLDDPALYSGPGSPTNTHGLVNLLLGFYDTTATFWNRAIVQAHRAETDQCLSVAREILTGQPLAATQATLELTGQGGLVETQANWEFELGLCLIESGDPVEAGKHFSRALLLNPRLVTRPLIEDYLKKLGVPIPAAAQPEAGETAAGDVKPEVAPAEVKAPAETKPDTPKP
ncbi:MAG: hypothetical protein JWN86_4168 [Planctomycetota bacterium]|nr:hypothetical protein [Planctomycetota bacterium]